MVEIVIKKDGSEEPFLREKIVLSMIKAGEDEKEARKAAQKIEDKFSDQKKVESSKIRNQVIKYLNRDKVISSDQPKNHLEKIKETEKFLSNEALNFGASETLLLAVENFNKFNELSRKIGTKKTVKMKGVDRVDGKIIIEIKVLPPSLSMI